MNKPKNHEIQSEYVYVNDLKSKLSLQEALDYAGSWGADLVEVGRQEKYNIPTCKLEHQPLEVSEMPMPLALIYELYNNEKHPLTKLRRLLDSLEVFVKIHTVFVINLFFEKDKDISEKVKNGLKELLARSLRVPSLGHWWDFTSQFAKAIKECYPDQEVVQMMSGFLLGSFAKEMSGNENFIWFRNDQAHGSTPPEDRCLEAIAKYGTKFEKAVKSAYHLKKCKLLLGNKNGLMFDASGTTFKPYDTNHVLSQERTYLKIDNTYCSLYPLLVYREDKNKTTQWKWFSFYNAFRSEQVYLLNYELCLHETSPQEIKSLFLERFPLKDWQKIDALPQDFRDRIEALTEVFKGRRVELKRIIDFASDKDQDFLFFWGNPGIGKSALLARVSQILGWKPELQQEYDFTINKSINKIHVIEYFIRRDMNTTDTGSMLEHLNTRLENTFKLGVEQGGNLQTQKENFEIRLRKVSEKLQKSSEKLLLIIDGLDEGSDSEGLLEVLPRSLPKGILVLYASRENMRVRDVVYTNLDQGHRDSLELQGLSEIDTRAFLEDYVNKYELKEDYVKMVTKRSQGNPLYIKLLCQGLLNQDYELNNLTKIPKQMSELYDKLFNRFSREE
ncbi:MAG: NACHT domain-containing protein [Leptospiraceae bacterium]|nr:NACHT domain-containing protein [Leptospiraceae bacterium]